MIRKVIPMYKSATLYSIIPSVCKTFSRTEIIRTPHGVVRKVVQRPIMEWVFPEEEKNGNA